MAASTLLRKTVSSEDWMTATKETRRQKCSLRLNTVIYKKKMFLGTTTLDQSFLYFTKIFVHLSVFVAACYFSVCKLIGWDPVNL